MRLHLNENTAGCSPAVLAALRELNREAAGFYPDYGAARASAARHFAVPEDHLLLTNGLDEGILAAVGAAFRDRSGGTPEAIGVAPAFDMYEVCTAALGGRMVIVRLGGSFELDPGAIAAALSPSTRIVFLTNPHNPSGRGYAIDTFTALAERIRPVTLFVDEAYADFSGESLIARGTFASHPNLIVGRTFSKSYGMAGLRVGAVLAAPRTLEPLRQVVPPYSLNAWAAAALPIAIHDHAYREWYCAQAAESRALLSEACARLALPTWPSAANFVLVRIGARARDVVRSLALRGVLVRDRSSETGCEGCIRITAGVVDDTRRVIAALEEVLCGAQ